MVRYRQVEFFEHNNAQVFQSELNQFLKAKRDLVESVQILPVSDSKTAYEAFVVYYRDTIDDIVEEEKKEKEQSQQ